VAAHGRLTVFTNNIHDDIHKNTTAEDINNQKKPEITKKSTIYNSYILLYNTLAVCGVSNGYTDSLGTNTVHIAHRRKDS